MGKLHGLWELKPHFGPRNRRPRPEISRLVPQIIHDINLLNRYDPAGTSTGERNVLRENW